jgi:hypothetical protein
MWGYRNLATAAHARRHHVVAARRLTSDRLLLVEIPSLPARFMGHDEAGQLMLTPLHDVAGTTLRAGETRQAREVLIALRPVALSVETIVPN